MGFLDNGGTAPATKNIILINVLVMVMIALNREFMIEHFALFYPSSPFFRPWQFVTHMFMHGGFWHIFFNMYTLYSEVPLNGLGAGRSSLYSIS